MGRTGCLPKLVLPNHAPGGGTVVTGLFATNLHPLNRAGSRSQEGLGSILFYRSFERDLPLVEL